MAKEKHRGPGEGSIFQRKDGRWTAFMKVEKTSKRKYYYGKTRAEVRDKLTAALADQQEGKPPLPEKQTLGQYLESWLRESAQPRVRPRTFESYSQIVRVHILSDNIAKKVLAKLQPQEVQAFLNAKHASGLSARTVQYIHAIIRTSLNTALRWGLLHRNVATLADPPRVKRQEIEPLTPEQAKVFLDAVREDRLSALYTVALTMGLRQGEALGLRWADVDLAAGTLRISVALSQVNGKLQLVEPKTERSRRTLHLPDVVAASLRQHRVRQVEERLAAGERWQDSGLVFTSTIGTALDPDNVTHRFQKALLAAGLPRIRFHDLRHSCASLLLAQGAELRTIMEVLGHSQISLTANTYAHVMPVLKKDAANKMDALFGGNSG